MRGGLSLTLIFLSCGPFTAIRALGQQQTPQQNAQPPGQAQKPPPTSNTDLPDPTKDPMKDPATDITKDPTKDPDAAAAAAQPANNTTKKPAEADAAGADAGVPAEAPDYTGPAILSRSFTLSRPTLPRNEHFRIYAGLNATYDSGLSGQYTAIGPIPSVNTFGADINWGASVLHYRRRDIFSLDYGGHYYDYGGGGTSPYNGQDHSLSAGYMREISPRFTIGLRENAGLYSNTYSVLNSAVLSDLSQISSTIVVAPNTEAFDDRTYFSTTTASLTYQKTARLSFNLTASYFLVRRDSELLADTHGYGVNANVAYRLSRRQTIGVYYSHSEYSYTKIIGDANADSVGANYSMALSKTMDVAVGGGVTRFDSQSLGEVIPNPLVQQVLGIGTGIEKFYFLGYAPDITATLNRRLRQSSVGASFTEGITPGNGLILTSRRESESVFWTLPLFHRAVTQVAAGRDILSGYAEGLALTGNYSSYYLRFSLGRPITRAISTFFNIDYRQYGFTGTALHQHEYRISTGLRFTSGTGAMKLW